MAATVEIISSANDLLAAHSALIQRVRSSQQAHRRQLQSLHIPADDLLQLPLLDTPPSSPLDDHDAAAGSATAVVTPPMRIDLPPAKRARVARYKNYVPEEETIRNDYSQRYVDGGEWPQNWVLGSEPEHRFEEYPKQQRLLALKKASVNNHSVAPTYLPFSALHTVHPAKFDVILIDPPFSSSFSWDDLQNLSISSLAADPSFVFLWVGSGAGEALEMGREVLAKWGYRRCEDVVWVKTNKTTNNGPGTDPPTTSLLTRTKQHCLIGIRGTVRRSTDSWFVHCNVDTDVIFWEGDDADPTRKPPEMYSLIENFCLGTRRLELFGRAPTSLRRGWVTALASGQESRLGLDPDGTGTVYSEEGAVARPWNLESWDADIKVLAAGGRMVVPTTSEIDALRPKSPVRPGSLQAQANHVPGTNVGPRFAAVNRAGFVPNPMGQIPQMMMGIPMNGMGMLGGAEGMMHGQWPGMMAMPGAGIGLNAGGMGINNGVMALNGAGMGSNGMLGQMGMGMAYNPAFNGAGWADQQYGMEGAWGDGSWGTNGQGQGGY